MRFVLLRGPRNRNSVAVLHRVLRKPVQADRAFQPDRAVQTDRAFQADRAVQTDRAVQADRAFQTDRAALPGVEVEVAAAPPPDLTAADILAYSFTSIDLDAVIADLAPLLAFPARPLLIAGGAHPSADPEGCLRLGFDVVFVGEAELTLPAFVAAWSRDPRRSSLPVERIIRPAEAYDLDSEPHADADTAEFPFLEISRGCPHACAFCQTPQMFGARMRFRSPEKAAAGVACAVARGHRRIRCLTTDAFSYGGGPTARVAQALDDLTGACRNAGAPTPRWWWASSRAPTRCSRRCAGATRWKIRRGP